jgi:hypothetical protein
MVDPFSACVDSGQSSTLDQIYSARAIAGVVDLMFRVCLLLACQVRHSDLPPQRMPFFATRLRFSGLLLQSHPERPNLLLCMQQSDSRNFVQILSVGNEPDELLDWRVVGFTVREAYTWHTTCPLHPSKDATRSWNDI